MATIESNISAASETFQANREGMLALIERVRGYEERSAATSAKSRERFEKRGQLLPRERLSLLLDPGTPFLPICSLAGLGLAMVAAWALARWVFETPFGVPASIGALGFLVVAGTALVGLLNSRDVVRRAPLEVLRGE